MSSLPLPESIQNLSSSLDNRYTCGSTENMLLFLLSKVRNRFLLVTRAKMASTVVTQLTTDMLFHIRYGVLAKSLGELTVATSLIRGAGRHSSLLDIVGGHFQGSSLVSLTTDDPEYNTHADQYVWTRALTLGCSSYTSYLSRETTKSARDPRAFRCRRDRASGAFG